MPTHEEHVARLRKIGEERRALMTQMQNLDREEQGILLVLTVAQTSKPSVSTPPPVVRPPPVAAPTTSGRGHRKREVVPLPVGKSIPRREVNDLKARIASMDKSAFDTEGRTFIHEWYPRLAKTPAWHEISTALQEHFGARRQEVAGIAAHVAIANGKDHVQARETRV